MHSRVVGAVRGGAYEQLSVIERVNISSPLSHQGEERVLGGVRSIGPCNEIVTSCDRMVTGLSYGVTQCVVY